MKLADQSTNYSTITQSFTLIDLVDEGSFFRWAVRAQKPLLQVCDPVDPAWFSGGESRSHFRHRVS